MYTTYWVPKAGADLDVLKAEHQLVFPNNELSIIDGWVKVAVANGRPAPLNGTTVKPTFQVKSIF